MKKSFGVTIFLVAVSFLIPSFFVLQAQTASIPSVYVKNIQLEKTDLKTGDVAKGTFQAITHSLNGASDIYFKVSLVGNYQKNNLAGSFYDSVNLDSFYNLKNGEAKTISFSYIIPQVKTGTGYGIQIQAMTHAGIPLGWSDVFIKINNEGGTQYLNIVSAKLKVGKNSFGLQQGPMVPADGSAVLDLIVSNPTASSVTITPTIDLYDHVVLGAAISTQSASSTTIAAKKQKEIFITLPTDNHRPLVYVSRVKFTDEKNVSVLPPLDVRYIVQGDIATIQTVTTDKKTFNSNDIINIILGFSGTPFDITTGKNQNSAIYDTDIKLLNDKKDVVASWQGRIDYNNATNTKTVALTATQPANGYVVDVTVSNLGKTITHYSTNISSDGVNLSQSSKFKMDWWYLLYGGILGLLIVTIVIIFKTRSKKVGNIFLILLAVAGLSYVFTNHMNIDHVDAQASVGLTEMTLAPWSSPVSGDDYGKFGQIFPSSPEVGTVFHPGDTINVTGSVVALACSNSPINEIKVQGVIEQIDASEDCPLGHCVVQSARDDVARITYPNQDNSYYIVNPQYSLSYVTPTKLGRYRLVTSLITEYYTSLNNVKPYYYGYVYIGEQFFTVVDQDPGTIILTQQPQSQRQRFFTTCSISPSEITTSAPGTYSISYSANISGGEPDAVYTYNWHSALDGAGVRTYNVYDNGTYDPPNETVDVSDGFITQKIQCPNPNINITGGTGSSDIKCEPKIEVNGQLATPTSVYVGQLVTWIATDVKYGNPIAVRWSSSESDGYPISTNFYNIRYSTIGNKQMSAVNTSTGVATKCVVDPSKDELNRYTLKVLTNNNFSPF